VELLVHVGELVVPGQPLFLVHGETRAELDYSFDYVGVNPEIVAIGDTGGER
jgi:hypothetical protein